MDLIVEWGYAKGDVRSEGVGIVAGFHDAAIEAADRIEMWLNEHTTTDGYSWGWHDGEFYLWPSETWEEA